MKQVFSRRGQVMVEEVPAPLCRPGGVLVRTAWSVVSTGTERADIAGQRLRDRLQQQPEVLGRVWQEVKRSGLAQTVQLVRDKTERPIPLGNSLAGVVAEVGAGVAEFAVGDRVACSGTGHAHHAGYVFVPRNLVVAVPARVDLKDAAFATLGAIALQGVRRAGIQLGETAVVIGLGLIGLLTVQILRAAGVRVIGIDPRRERAALAERLGAERGLGPDGVGTVRTVAALTGGAGADAVLLTAGTPSSEPVNQAFELARDKGRVVVVGSVGLELSRPTFYRKELDLTMSRSTGPGRYDPIYEEQGVDYPLSHVRWTERRNMAAFLGLLDAGSVRVAELIAGEFEAEDAPRAYGALDGSGLGVATLLHYSEREVPSRMVTVARTATTAVDVARVAVIGAGQFARQTLLPILRRQAGIRLRAIVGGNSGTGVHDARRFRAERYGTDPLAVLDDPDVDAVIIATRHDLHASLAVAAARRGKAVFVEKPLALSEEECRSVARAVDESGALLTVGFNRRFAPLARRARAALAEVDGPATALYRVNAGGLPPGHWLLDPVQGGGRIVGEGCHFFDLLCWLLGEEPAWVQAMAPAHAGDIPQELTVTVRFSRGSVGTVLYTGSGHASVPKERIEVFKGGRAVVLEDFRVLRIDGSTYHASRDEKGYDAELSTFLRAVRGESALEVTVQDGVRATMLALRALEAAGSGTTIAVNWTAGL